MFVYEHSIVLPDMLNYVFSNQGLWLALLVTLKVMSNASGATVLVSSLLVTICCAKFHPEILAVLFVLARYFVNFLAQYLSLRLFYF